MKLKVKKEGRDNIYLVEKQEIIDWLKFKKFKDIHHFNGNGNMFIGADHSIESVIEDIKQSDRIGILTGSAQSNNLRHALSVIIGKSLEMFDIGKITEDDLEIINLK